MKAYYFCDSCDAQAEHMPACIHCNNYFCPKHGTERFGIEVCSACDAKIERVARIQERNHRARPVNGLFRNGIRRFISLCA